MNLSLTQANNARNSLTKVLYERLFKEVVFMLNNSLTNCAGLHTKMKINLLDIAGFGEIIRDLLDKFLQMIIE